MTAGRSPLGGATPPQPLYDGRRVLAPLALSIIALAAPASATAQALWRGLEAGASPDEVRRAHPDAAAPIAVATLADGETDDLVTHGIFWGDRLMEVRFFFREGKLASVQLTPAGGLPADSAANLQLARGAADDVSAQYGAPYECGDKSFADVSLFECKWISQSIVVRLWYEDAAGQSPTLRIAFRKAGDVAYDF